MEIDIKKYRKEKLKISVEELANHLDYDVADIQYMESLGIYSPEYIQEFCHYFSVNPLDLKKEKVIKKRGTTSVELNDWEIVENYKDRLLKQLDCYVKDVTNEKLQTNSDFLISQYNATLRSLDEVSNAVKLTFRKPTVAIVGMSDAGKSTLVNHLLNADKMPVSWTPTTSVTVIVKHIQDRPEFLTDELIILGGQETLFDVEKLDDENYVEKYTLIQGEADLLHMYGTRQGNKMTEATHAILYLNSELLKVCDFVDLPGFGTGADKDDTLAQQSYNFADIVIYLSTANGFLKGNDIEFIKTSLQSLNPLENDSNNLANLCNLYVLSSQAHTVGDRTQLEMILDKGMERLYKEIPTEVWEQREEVTDRIITEADLRKRFFTFTTNTPFLRKDFENDLYKLLKEVPQLTLKRGQELIRGLVYERREALQDQLSNIHHTMTEYEGMLETYESLKNQEGVRLQQVTSSKGKLLLSLKKKELDSLRAFKTEYENILSEQHIIEVIEKNNYKKKKEDLERLVSYISTQLQTKLQSVITNYAEKFHDDIEKFLEDYDKSIKFNVKGDVNVSNISIPFNTKAIFAGTVAGLGTFGALSIWAAGFGNLGAYILVAKGVSVLSALGISVGGTAAAVSGVAAIGGPVVLGIAIAAILGLSIWKLFSGGWKKDIVKLINKQFSEQKVEDKLISEIRDFWQMTNEEIVQAINELEVSYQSMLHDLRENLAAASSEQLPKKKEIVESNLKMYEQILIELN